MDEAWERAVEAALDGQAAVSSSSSSSPRTLTLDGAVKCLHGRLPPPSLFEKFQSLEHLSIANIGVSSLEKFPRLRNLQRLILSDNRIAGGLEFLVEAGLDSLRDLDLSNNRIQFLEDLAPLAQLQLVSLDLYECPVTRVKDYRSRVFGMIRSLKYLDKMDADENERPESDEEEEDDDDDEEDEIDGDDPGSGEIDGENQGRKVVNSVGGSGDGVVDVDEDESDADEEETETGSRRVANGFHQHHSNGFRLAAVGEEVDEDVDDEEDEEYDEEDGDDDEMGEEIDADDGEDEDVVEVHDVVDNDDNEDGIQEEEDDDDDDDEVDDDDDADEDEVEDEEEEWEPGSAGRVTSAEGEIDGHEQGEEDENGELGEADVEGVEEERDSEDDDGDEEEDVVGEYLVQPIPQPERAARSHGDSDACDEDEEEVDDEDNRPSIDSIPSQPSSSSQNKSKRKRDDNSDLADDSVEDLRSSKQ